MLLTYPKTATPVLAARVGRQCLRSQPRKALRRAADGCCDFQPSGPPAGANSLRRHCMRPGVACDGLFSLIEICN